MVDRRVKVTAELDASGVVKGAKEAEQAMEGAAKGMTKAAKGVEASAKTSGSAFSQMAQSARSNEAVWTRTGTALTVFGASTALALGGSVKAAVDWESAWAGVEKTVDGSATQMAQLEESLRGMARELPASHQEIAAVAEAAGQLGVGAEDIDTFTRTMIDLGETTNLSADEAATAIAQMANVMGTSGDDIDNLGSALVELGNNGASTERQIIQMAQGMAGAASIVGLAESDVLGFANAFASVGIEVEAGASSFSRSITDMAKAVATGSDDLTIFAEVAGMTAEQFATAFKDDPAEAFASFISGLGDMQAAGEDVFTVLDDLGMSDVRVSRALLSMATSGDLLTDSLALGAQAWSENTALADEAAKRYETTAAQLQVLKNNITDAAISFGEVLLPALGEAAEAGADFAGWIADLPGPIKRIGVEVAGVTSATALMTGGFLLAVPQAIKLYDTFKDLQASAPLVAGGIRGVVGAAAGLTALLVLAELNQAVKDWASPAADLEQMARAIEDVGTAGEFAETNLDWMTTRRFDLLTFQTITEGAVLGSDALDRLAESAKIAFADEVWDRLGRLQNSGSLERFIEDASGLDAILTQMVQSGNTAAAADIFERWIAVAQEGTGVTFEELAQGFPQYDEALKTFTDTTEGAVEATESLSGAFVRIDTATLQQKADDIFAANYLILDSFIDLAADIGDTEISLDAWWQQIEDQFAAQAAFVDNIAYLRGQGMNEAFVQGLIEQGPAGAGRTQEIVDAMTGGEAANAEWLARGDEFADGLDQGLRDGLSESDPVVIQAEIAEIATQAEERRAELESVFLRDPATMEVDADTTPAQEGLEQFKTEADGTTAEPRLDLYVNPATGKLESFLSDADSSTGTATLDADNSPALTATDEWWYASDNTTGTATLDADNGPGLAATNRWQYDADAAWGTANLDANTSAAYAALRAFAWSAANTSVSIGLSASGGRAYGGYTGPGSKFQPAGIVHADEFVHTKENLAKPGMLQFHSDLWQTNDLDGAYQRHKLRGFADGGPVGYAPQWSAPAAQMAGAGGIDGAALAAPIAAAVGAEMSKYRIISFDGRELGRLVESGRRAGSYV